VWLWCIDSSVAVCSKAVLRLLDIDMGQARLPLPRITDDVLEAMRDDLTSIGFFDWALPKYAWWNICIMTAAVVGLYNYVNLCLNLFLLHRRPFIQGPSIKKNLYNSICILARCAWCSSALCTFHILSTVEHLPFTKFHTLIIVFYFHVVTWDACVISHKTEMAS